jgi:hypothetical protein
MTRRGARPPAEALAGCRWKSQPPGGTRHSCHQDPQIGSLRRPRSASVHRSTKRNRRPRPNPFTPEAAEPERSSRLSSTTRRPVGGLSGSPTATASGGRSGSEQPESEKTPANPGFLQSDADQRGLMRTGEAPRGGLNSIQPSLSGERCRSIGYVERPSSRFSLGTPFPTPNRTRNRLRRNAAIRSLSHDITSRYSTPASSRIGRRLPAIWASAEPG